MLAFSFFSFFSFGAFSALEGFVLVVAAGSAAAFLSLSFFLPMGASKEGRKGNQPRRLMANGHTHGAVCQKWNQPTEQLKALPSAGPAYKKSRLFGTALSQQ